jgi:hypothetical protein
MPSPETSMIGLTQAVVKKELVFRALMANAIAQEIQLLSPIKLELCLAMVFTKSANAFTSAEVFNKVQLISWLVSVEAQKDPPAAQPLAEVVMALISEACRKASR